YGLGAYYIYTRQKGKVDPLGPKNMLGFLTGPLTGTTAITGNRYAVVGKSPKCGTWGDANSGGSFGPGLKWAGGDGVFFTGRSKTPVYLLIENGEASILSAKGLWGKDSNKTEDLLKKKHGKNAQIACIGPAGERKALLACIMNDKGRAAGRSGLGAVMGSKKLKAIVAVGNRKVSMADPAKMQAIRKKCLAAMKTNGFYEVLTTYGTSGITAGATVAGDTPIKNWKGVPADMPNVDRISDEAIKKYQVKKFACWRCPIGCGGHCEVATGKFKVKGAHKPEYETLGAFGVMCLNDNPESIIKVNHICNLYGLDTISAGCTVAFAMECFEKGILTKKQLDGIDLTWGNAAGVVKLTEKIAKGQGCGKLFENGMAAAAKKLGKGASKYAMHVHGEELPMHDPRCNPGLGSSYVIDATPGRHTQFSAWPVEGEFAPSGFKFPKFDKYKPSGKAKVHKTMSNFMHVVNSAGLCMFGVCAMPHTATAQFLSATMGKRFTMKDIDEIGARIASLRMAFNCREGKPNLKFKMPSRVVGQPPLKDGPLAGVTVNHQLQIKEYLQVMGWDTKTGKPKKTTLKKLGLEFAAKDM
ncbi:MAG: aldehyde ferredoxin oxidoreductase family protein, partial [Planctomycetes bacterium]|nr:aldehyde ferredoxin oxidoreductase family protein [Planctomycetota bacterium]